jgi:hypothetical protein
LYVTSENKVNSLRSGLKYLGTSYSLQIMNEEPMTSSYDVPDNPPDPEAAALELIVRLPAWAPSD